MGYWADDRRLYRDQQRLDAEQDRAAEKLIAAGKADPRKSRKAPA